MMVHTHGREAMKIQAVEACATIAMSEAMSLGGVGAMLRVGDTDVGLLRKKLGRKPGEYGITRGSSRLLALHG